MSGQRDGDITDWPDNLLISRHQVIGVFDSGIGGLSVLREIRNLRREFDLLYVADRARAPYGSRSLESVRDMSHQIAAWLVDRGASTIVVACNTASAAALESLRKTFDSVEFVGMEPAVKPAAAVTSSGAVGVLATEATFQGRLFRSVVTRFAGSAQIVTRSCPRWVELVELGQLEGRDVEEAVREEVEPLIADGVDLLVVGCTHFSFLIPVIERVAGEGVQIIDPAPAVAAQTARVGRGETGTGRLSLATSGDPDEFEMLAMNVAGIKAVEPVLLFVP